MDNEHKVIVTGRDRQISFPQYCPNCNAPAQDPLLVQRVFTRYSSGGGEGGGGSGRYQIVTSFKIPFCHSCRERHRQEEKPLTWRNWLIAFLRGGMLIVPAAYIFFLSLNNLWRIFFEAILDADLILTVIYGGLGALSLGVVSMLYIGARQLSRPYLVVPPTSITSAVDFSDGQRSRTFKFRHEGYAERFREANIQLLQSPGQAPKGIPWRWAFRLLLLGAVAAVVWWLFIQGVL